jgi:ornithine carbamoyltransferase
MRGRHLLTVGDLDARDLLRIIDVAAEFKRVRPGRLLEGRQLALVFEKPSTRTKAGFEVGMKRLGGDVTYFSGAEVGLGTREPVKDVARVLSRMYDIIAARTMAQATVEELAHYATVPVINALSDTEHPCQALADLMTIREHMGELKGVQLAYIGDGNNVAASLVQACAMAGLHVTLSCPEGYEVPAEPLARAEAFAARSGGSIRQVAEPAEAVREAQIIYTDVWISMGQERETAIRREVFAPYTVDMELVSRAPAGVLIMHDLPAHRGEEITDDVMESPGSIVFDQAENRLHSEQALLALMLGGVRDEAFMR